MANYDLVRSHCCRCSTKDEKRKNESECRCSRRNTTEKNKKKISIHYLGLFENYDSIQDIKTETNQRKITIPITTTIIKCTIYTRSTNFSFSF